MPSSPRQYPTPEAWGLYVFPITTVFREIITDSAKQLTALTQPTPEDLRKEIQRCKAMTKNPFAVNLTLLPALVPPDYDAYAQVIIDEGIRIGTTFPPLRLQSQRFFFLSLANRRINSRDRRKLSGPDHQETQGCKGDHPAQVHHHPTRAVSAEAWRGLSVHRRLRVRWSRWGT